MNARNLRSPRPNPRKKIGRKNLFVLNFVLFLIPVTYFGYQPLLRYSTTAISSTEEPKPADAIILLAGGDPGRAWGAADLYNQKIAPYIVLSREPIDPEVLELGRRGVKVPSGFDMNKYILHGLGVPDEAIVHVEPFVND